MLVNCYQNTFPGRINDGFIGIASRYSQYKKGRKAQEARKKSLESNYLYTQHKERKLQRSIYSKSVELSRLQSSRIRKLEEIKAKEELKELRQFQLQQLRERNIKVRQINRRKLEAARSRLLTMNQEGWNELKANHKNETQSLKKRIQSKLKAKAKQCLIIRQQQSFGLQKVDFFHKRKNSQNLEAYLKRIKEENKIKRQEEAKVRRLGKEIQKLNKSVSLKANYLNCLDQEISKYRTEIQAVNRQRLRPNQADEEAKLERRRTTVFASIYQRPKCNL